MSSHDHSNYENTTLRRWRIVRDVINKMPDTDEKTEIINQIERLTKKEV